MVRFSWPEAVTSLLQVQKTLNEYVPNYFPELDLTVMVNKKVKNFMKQAQWMVRNAVKKWIRKWKGIRKYQEYLLQL